MEFFSFDDLAAEAGTSRSASNTNSGHLDSLFDVFPAETTNTATTTSDSSNSDYGVLFGGIPGLDFAGPLTGGAIESGLISGQYLLNSIPSVPTTARPRKISTHPKTTQLVPPTTSASNYSISSAASTTSSINESSSSHSSANSNNGPVISLEEKRRRSQLASAKFRQRKKLQYQQLEEQLVQLMQERDSLKRRLEAVESENRVLKDLIIGKP